MSESATSEAKRAKPRRPVPLSIQWHITTECGNRCKHCYVFDSSTFENERQNTLSLDDLLRVVARLEEFEKSHHAKFNPFVISGGDPLLREDWAEFVGELRRRGRTVFMMANPETLTETSVAKLVELGVKRVQMSLDGLEGTHDHFRSKGSFRRTVAKLELLHDHGIRGQIMSTLYPANAADLIPLMRTVAAETKAYSFTFDLGCFVGNAAELTKGLRPGDLRTILAAYLGEKERLREEGYSLVVGEKCHLLKLARFENGTYYPSSTKQAGGISGCAAGWAGLVLLSNGAAMACRRLPITVGKLP